MPPCMFTPPMASAVLSAVLGGIDSQTAGCCTPSWSMAETTRAALSVAPIDTGCSRPVRSVHQPFSNATVTSGCVVDGNCVGSLTHVIAGLPLSTRASAIASARSASVASGDGTHTRSIGSSAAIHFVMTYRSPTRSASSDPFTTAARLRAMLVLRSTRTTIEVSSFPFVRRASSVPGRSPSARPPSNSAFSPRNAVTATVVRPAASPVAPPNNGCRRRAGCASIDGT